MLHEILMWALIVLVLIIVLPIMVAIGLSVLISVLAMAFVVGTILAVTYVGSVLYNFGCQIGGWFKRTAGCQ